MNDLVAGGNAVLPDGTLTLRVPGPFDLSVIVTGESGKVDGDGDFVFYNQPSAPGARLHGDTVTVDPRGLRPGAARVTVVVSPADPGTRLGALPLPVLSVAGSGGGVLARFAPPRPGPETVLMLAELYRRGTGWKIRALGQGYADGLAGVARDFGVDVADEEDGAHATPTTPTTYAAHAPHGPDATGKAFAALVNAERSAAGVPSVTVDHRLVAAARAHAADLAARGRLAAESPDGTSLHHRIAATGYRCLTVAEHLVSGPRTPAEFVAYCLGGSERAAPFRDPSVAHVGVGHAAAPSGDTYWTAVWAAPMSPGGLARLAAEVTALTNAERAAAGLRPLAADPRLAAAAQAHSDDMVARDFYAHTSPEGSEPWDRARAAGCPHPGIGENIACGQRSAAEVVRGWMNSPGHRANILKPDFAHIGVGYATGSRAGTYWTQLFGT
ncbi:CAP domain-containing protein [Streptomyces telluris]|uniref:CAP domain-containing protein n=1 Tax=Streptomyces telluris TaxID=2720021 RepID=A0A9X2RNI1_9ACTN|nr:CAP domain-containing protein [Streptomyces telluris]MCQ8772034.1 CAP domain-containing protein [Streptomyces telluris]NJP81013.1 stress protein [Streptomyces telluris]